MDANRVDAMLQSLKQSDLNELCEAIEIVRQQQVALIILLAVGLVCFLLRQTKIERRIRKLEASLPIMV